MSQNDLLAARSIALREARDVIDEALKNEAPERAWTPEEHARNRARIRVLSILDHFITGPAPHVSAAVERARRVVLDSAPRSVRRTAPSWDEAVQMAAALTAAWRIIGICESQFRNYAEGHEAQGKTDKAQTNRHFQDMCRDWATSGNLGSTGE